MTLRRIIFTLTMYACGNIRIAARLGLFARMILQDLFLQFFEENIRVQTPILLFVIELIKDKRSMIRVEVICHASDLRFISQPSIALGLT